MPPGPESLDATQCWELLRTTDVGRLAVSVGQHPDIFPINYIVDDESVVFRTAEGTKLASVFIGPAVAFEIDGYDDATGDAWSVVIKGRAEEVDLFDSLEEDIPVHPWSGDGVKTRFVRVTPDEVTGRRFHAVQRRR